MKSILTVAVLLAGLAGPALAEEATTQPPPPGAQAAVIPSQDAAAAEAAVPAALPQSTPDAGDQMSAPLDANGAPPARDGGCAHAKDTVYLTN